MSSVRRVLPWVWTGLLAASAFLALILRGLEGDALDAVLSPIAAVAVVGMAAFGAIISSRQPGNRIAWLFQAISVLFLVVVASSIVVAAIDPGSPDFPDTWDYLAIFALDGISFAMFHTVFLLLYVFPTGRFLTRRWTWAGWSLVFFASSSLLAISFTEELEQRFVDSGWRIPNPIGFLPPEVFEFINLVWLACLMLVAVGGVVALIVRYRRPDVVVRAQIKWVLLAAVISAICLPIGFGDFALAGLLLMIALLINPVVITVAITKYKLFEIDRIISRTISYSIVVALLVAAFLGVITLITSLLPTGSSVAVAGSTLAVAALFNPLRRRTQQAVDRRFNRSSYRAQAISEEFSATLQESLSIEEMAASLTRTVNVTLQPDGTAIWIRSGSRTS